MTLVVAAAIFDASGRVLIAERPAGKHMAGRWEFPGGKVAPGESEEAALARELEEELGIAVTDARPMMRLTHRYPDREVELSMWMVGGYRGEPRALDGQRLKWVQRTQLAGEDILEADRPFVAALVQWVHATEQQIGPPMAAKSDLPEVRLDPAALYREEIYTDRRAGTIRRLTPVTVDGAPDPKRPVLFSGQTQLLTPAGVLPLAFEIEAGTLEEALAKFPEGVNAALEQAIDEARELRREAASRIVVPEVGASGIGPGPGPGGPGGGGKIKFP